jgi:TolB protein
MRLDVSVAAAALLALAAPVRGQVSIERAPASGERHLSNLRQLTNVGTQAEAYFSRDGKWITFQSTRDGRACDQQYVMRADGTEFRRISTGGGKTTCGWFLPDGKKLFFGSSHASGDACPVKPDPSKGYVWGLDPFDIYTVNRDGSDLRRLTNFGVYTAEGVLSPDGKRIVFTSLKGGDLDIYTMNVDGTDVRQLTRQPGYDGGPWWSPDGKQIAYRAYHPTDSVELKDYRDLLAQHIVRPSKMELWVMNADGSNQRQITHLGGANFGPSWTHDGKHLIFSSNFKSPRSGNFDLYLIGLDGTGLEQVTTDEGFDGFPMFSPDGKKLIWASQRADPASGDVNLFIANWLP